MKSKYNIKFYNSIKKILKGPMKLVFNAEINGIDNLPDKPYILAGNHKNMLDVVLLITNIPDEIHFMAKKELFDLIILKDIFSKMGAFPVDRDKADIKAIKQSLRILKNNEVLGIFPEGTRNKTEEELLKFKHGAVVIAKNTNTPIVPFYINGKYKVFRKGLELHFGNPIDVSNMTIEEANNYLREEVLKLSRK